MKEKEEIVIFSIHQHPWFFAKFICTILFFALLVFISLYFFGASKITSYIIIFGISYSIFSFFYNYYLWSNTQYLLTSSRIISYEQKKLFHKEMKEALLANSLFISHETKGIVNNIINRGSISIGTSGIDKEEIVLKNISNPFEIEQKIIEIQKKYSNREEEIKSSKKQIIR